MITDVVGWDVHTINTPGTVTVAGANPFFVNHFFYGDGGTEPGFVECSFPANANFVSAGDGDLSTAVECHLDLGSHWFSQQVRLDYNPFGWQHLWATKATAVGDPAAFRNPGNGFLSGCVDWEPANSTCGMAGQDFLFELLGKPSTIQVDTPPVPTLGRWGLVLLVIAFSTCGAYVLRQRA